MIGPPKPKFTEPYDSIPKDYLASRMMEYPFDRCGVWQAFDVHSSFYNDARACMKVWQKHARQSWEINKKPDFMFQFRRLM